MNTEMFNVLYDYYKIHYNQIEKNELYKWKAVVHFQEHWDIEANDFPTMLKESLRETKNLLSSGMYYPRKMIILAAKQEPDNVRELFRQLYDLTIDIKVRIEKFQDEVNAIIERHKEGKISHSYQDDRAVMVYLNMRYPEKYYLYKYQMFVDFAKLIDYAELPKAGDIDLVFLFESMCDMILKRVMQDEELLTMYESRRQKYYDPAYHLLVQDIIYSAQYFNAPEILEEEKKIEIESKEFTLKAKKIEVKLKGVHVDHIDKAESQKKIGDEGEEFVYQIEREKVKKYKLSKDKIVRWVSKLDGDGLGYDILSYDKQGNPIFIEVKTTTGSENGNIYITANELEMSESHSEQYYLYRVYDFDMVKRKGKLSIRKGSLKPLCISAQIYKVNFE